MKLNKLIIQGFKSFKDRTIINFDDGITGIVGPNGCGKSNIVDALFWVMGEQSAKHLRGQNMKDLIFAGSSKYTPGAWAEASLILENDEGKHIHIGNKVVSPSEIQLTRKLYRNGETEYRINGTPARLKDLQEVFMDTGAGAKSYSIIAQGEINRLVQAKPEERRVMIEEVAGVTKFKLRKRESMKKIEQTHNNLQRISDLQLEIEKNLKTLQKQAEKAARAKSLREKIRRHDLITSSHKEFDLLKNFREAEELIETNKLNLEQWSAKKGAIEISLEEERVTRDDQIASIEELQSEYNKISRELAASEERLNYLRKSTDEKNDRIEERHSQKEELQSELLERNERIAELNIQKENIENESREELNLQEEEDRVALLKESVEEIKTEVLEQTAKLNDVDESIRISDQELFKVNSRLEEYSSSLADLTKEIEQIEAQYSGVSKEASSERERISQKEKELESLKVQESALRQSVASIEADHISERAKFDILREEKMVRESKFRSLKEIVESLDGLKDGTQRVLEGNDFAARIGQVIESDQEYSSAVENLISHIVDSVVLSSNEQSINLSNTDEAFDMIVSGSSAELSNESLERISLNGMKNVRSVVDVIKFKEGFEYLEKCFSTYLIADEIDLDLASNISSDINFRAIASKDGKVLIQNYNQFKVVSVIDPTQESSLVAKNNQIRDLETEINEMVVDFDAAKIKVEELNLNLENSRKELSLLTDKRIEATGEYASAKSAYDARMETFESSNARLAILQNRKSEISRSRLSLLESEDQIGTKIKGLTELKEKISTELEGLKTRKEDSESNYTNEHEQLLQKQINAKTYVQRLDGIVSQLEDATKQVERISLKISSTDEFIENLNAELDESEREQEELATKNLEVSNNLEQREEILNIQKDQFADLAQNMLDRENEVKELGRNISKADKDLVAAETKVVRYIEEEEQLVRDIFEKYRVDLRVVLGAYLEFNENDYKQLNDISNLFVMLTENGEEKIEREPFDFTRRYGRDLDDSKYKFKNYSRELSQLGDINWQAVADYERQKLRSDFLREQEVELKTSVENLENAILQIDEKSKTRFKLAFEEVDERFKKVFPIIFGGGFAQLKIVGDLDDVTCGIDIIAQPPGKKMQNINLMSGGEKALTAVSLIFSIFLVKPSPFCLLDEVDAPLDDANVGRFNELLREMSNDSQFILITHNKKTMELNDTLYGVTMQEPGVSKAVSVQLH